MNSSSGPPPAARAGNVYRRHALVGTSLLLMLQQCCHPINAFSSSSLSWTVKNHPKAPQIAQKRRSNTNTRLFDIPPEQEPRIIPPMMSGINGDNSTTAAAVNGLSSSTSHDSVNGSGREKANGPVLEEINGSSSSSSTNGEKEERHKSVSPTAPEVNNWTSIMVKGLYYKKQQMETVDQVYKDLRDMSRFDCEQVERYWDQLMPTVSYLGTERVARIYDALRVAYRAHRGQMRKSGEPYIIHPVEVALLLAGLKMDGETVMAGLLHDTVEDTDLTFELIEGMFGKVVRSIVEGETKVSKLPKLAFSDYADEQAENLRQMFVAMTDDYRIIIVKLADRLHNMRTLRHMKPEKQIKISRETLEIFAPLAHRMGIWQFKSELEDTSFMYLYPQEYKRLNRRLRQHQTKFRDTLDKSQELLAKRLSTDPTLRDQAFEVKVSGRTKEIYSLWHKMETKGERDLDHIVDVVALRVVITPKATEDEDENDTPDRGVWLCYHVLGLVQHLPGFQPVPTRVKDYISFPKPNGYQSLHTALILNGQTIEVQIRTSMMHQIAEYGMASHWAYTDGKKRTNGGVYNTPWLSSIKEWQNDILSARDFVDSVRSELLGKRVFVFLRNGKILNLARGTTAIDAAFQIHTEVGLTMHGVEINGKPVSSFTVSGWLCFVSCHSHLVSK
jgi:GTP pyrophosphokinase